MLTDKLKEIERLEQKNREWAEAYEKLLNTYKELENEYERLGKDFDNNVKQITDWCWANDVDLIIEKRPRPAYSSSKLPPSLCERSSPSGFGIYRAQNTTTFAKALA